MQVVTAEEFEPYKAELAECKRDVAFLMALLTGQQWLSSQQTMLALDVCKTTLWKLTKQGTLGHRYQGRKLQYDAFSIRTYLSAKKIDSYRIDERVCQAAKS